MTAKDLEAIEKFTVRRIINGELIGQLEWKNVDLSDVDLDCIVINKTEEGGLDIRCVNDSGWEMNSKLNKTYTVDFPAKPGKSHDSYKKKAERYGGPGVKFEPHTINGKFFLRVFMEELA